VEIRCLQLIGIMQGRLLPPQGGRFQCFPVQGWAEEFAFAAQAGLDCIEWIYDVYGEDANPIATDAGVSEIRSLSQQHQVAVRSLCADYFMERPLVRTTPTEQRERIERLTWLLSRCHFLGITRIALPFVDQSKLSSDQEIAEAAAILRDIAPGSTIEIHLETSLEPRAFAALLEKLPFPNLKANYDIGNSASLGYDFREELSAYGERIGSVHIKDRVRGGGTVPLGEGDADIAGVLAGLHRIGYSGDFILQVARGEPGKEVEWAQHNRKIVESHRAAIQQAQGQAL
jgi:L-ribulose-5-phosphate 3-epimerase